MGGGADGAAGGVTSRAGVSPDNTIMNRIMLRFRPIAPKPATGSGGLSAEEPKEGFSGSGRRKRRYVRVCGTRKGNAGDNIQRERKSSRGPKEDNKGCRSEEEEVKTLRLLPDEGAEEENNSRSAADKEGRDPGPLDLNMAEIRRLRMEAESWVTVLSLTDACMGGGGLGCTDEDKWRYLADEACPGFISDTDNHVVWSNAAYRRMVAAGVGDEAEAVEVTVRLAVSDALLLPVMSPAFACMVRVQYTWRQERGPEDLERPRLRGGGGKAMVVPCDVWRMSGGGFAWRIDVKAGLSLGWSCII